MTSKVTYLGDLRTSSIHLQSGTEILSDAPLDNNGKGEAFSPTDTVANALASCMMTIMGIKARDMNVDLKGSVAEVTKIMNAEPRRIGAIEIVFEITVSSIGRILAKSMKALRGYNCSLVAFNQPKTSILVTAETMGST